MNTAGWWIILNLMSPLTGEPEKIWFKRFDDKASCEQEVKELLSTPGLDFFGTVTPCFYGRKS